MDLLEFVDIYPRTRKNCLNALDSIEPVFSENQVDPTLA